MNLLSDKSMFNDGGPAMTSNMPQLGQPKLNLGLPQTGGPIGFASGNTPELKRGTLANQAFGRYY
jgi:hypothetical protein